MLETACYLLKKIYFEKIDPFFFEGLGATLNVAKPPKGSTVAIFGLGAVGLAVSFSKSLLRVTHFL